MKILNIIVAVAIIVTTSCCMRLRNTLEDCRKQCEGCTKSKACCDFCNCIHEQGLPLDQCLDVYENAAGGGKMT